MSLPYNPSRNALFHPEHDKDLFRSNHSLDILPLAVEAARLAYIQAETSSQEEQRLHAVMAKVGFTSVDFFSDPVLGGYAFGAYRPVDDLALVAFRGTQVNDMRDLCTNLTFKLSPWSAGGQVHTGFAQSAQALFPPIQSWLNSTARLCQTLVLCGHSLGAALATLIASLLPAPLQLIVLGSPRIGDQSFVDSLAGVNVLRLVNCCDLIPRIPPEYLAYRHLGQAHYITRQGHIEIAPSERAVIVDQNLGRISHLRYLLTPNAERVRDLADHAPINYARVFFQ